MDKITELIKEEIKRQYKSLNKFSEVSGIPYSTLANALSRGIGTMSYDTVIKICNLLNLKQAFDSDLTIFNAKFQDICNMLGCLDNEGVHTVETVLKVEYDRCTHNGTPRLKSYNGIAMATSEDNFKQQIRVNDLINEAAFGSAESVK